VVSANSTYFFNLAEFFKKQYADGGCLQSLDPRAVHAGPGNPERTKRKRLPQNEAAFFAELLEGA
jgi:hypothetical protein